MQTSSTIIGRGVRPGCSCLWSYSISTAKPYPGCFRRVWRLQNKSQK